MLNKDNQYGVIDAKGNIIVEAIYDNIKIPNPEKGVFICLKKGKNIALNENSEQIFTEYEEITPISINGVVSNIPYEKDVLKYKQNGKYGLIDYNGKKVTNAIYDEIDGLSNKESEILVKRNDKYGVINKKGAKLIKEEYDTIIADGYYEEESKYKKSGYIVSNKTENGYRYGYINYKLEKLLKVEYNEIARIQDIEDKNNIYLIASKNGKYGVQKNNKTLISFSYQGIDYNKESKIFEIQRNSKFGVFDIYGNEIVPIEYDEIETKGIYLEAVKGDEVSYFNTLGNEIKDSEYSSLINAGENYYITINKDGLYGVNSKQNEVIIENEYKYIEYLFNEYFIASKSEDKLGIIDIQGNVIVDFKYDVLQKIDDTNIIEGKILKENLSELYSETIEQINSDNNVAIYKENNYIVVHANYFTKYFDLKGNEVSIKEVFKNNKLFSVRQNDLFGYEDKDGNLSVDYKYDNATEFNEYGFAGIQKDGKWGVINSEGKVIVEPIYHIEENNRSPEFLGEYYKVYYGYGEVYYTNNINE